MLEPPSHNFVHLVEDHRKSSEDDLHIEPNRLGLNITDIQLDHLIEGGLVFPVYLPQSRESRQRIEALFLPRMIIRILEGRTWPRSDNAHFSTNDIQ